MAHELGITKSAYSKIEREETNVSLKRLNEIAKILEVDVDDLIKGPKLAKAEDPQKNYGFATKGDIEEVVRMINEISKELSSLKTSFNNMQLSTPRKKRK